MHKALEIFGDITSFLVVICHGRLRKIGTRLSGPRMVYFLDSTEIGFLLQVDPSAEPVVGMMMVREANSRDGAGTTRPPKGAGGRRREE